MLKTWDGVGIVVTKQCDNIARLLAYDLSFSLRVLGINIGFNRDDDGHGVLAAVCEGRIHGYICGYDDLFPKGSFEVLDQ